MFQELMPIAGEEWHALHAMFMSKINGLIKFQKKKEGEDDMLDQAYDPKKNSRLSCQIEVSDNIDGLEVNLPEKQV